MGRMYSMSFDNLDVDTADATIDFFELIAPTVGVGILHSVRVAQVSQLGDANEEIIAWSIVTGNTSSGTGGATGVEVPLSLGDSAATAVGLTGSTTVASSGTEAIKHIDAFNLRVGLLYVPIPEERISWSANRLCVRMLDAVANDNTTVSGTILWEEIS